MKWLLRMASNTYEIGLFFSTSRSRTQARFVNMQIVEATYNATNSDFTIRGGSGFCSS